MQKYRVLLADDHEVVRAGIHNALRELDNLEIVGEVGDGHELQQALSFTAPDLLLIDVDMPHFQPIIDIQQIKIRYPRIKILVVSAHDDDVYVQGLLGAGVNGYHMKDQPLNDLRLAVRRVLDGQRWVTGRLLDKLLLQPSRSEPLPKLTARQQDILLRLKQGLDNQSIAREIGLSVKTIENHLTRIYRQLGVQSRLEAVNMLLSHPELLSGESSATSAAVDSGTHFVSTEFQSETRPQEAVPRVVLIVDDNSRYRSMLHRTLTNVVPDGRFVEARNIEEATAMMLENRPQLALIDVVLGSESGIDCTKQLAKLNPQLRIVLITAYPDREFHRIGIEAGASALVDKKDLNADVLRAILEDIAPHT